MVDLSGLKQYQNVNVETKVNVASPHTLVAMLLDGVLDKLAKAHGYLQRNEISAKGQEISSAIKILDTLRVSLDMEKGGEIANNLHDLYEYMANRLLEANRDSNPDIIREIQTLISEIKTGWDSISDSSREVPLATGH